MCTNQGFKSFIPDSKKVFSKYLYYWLKANREYLDGLGNGATFKELSRSVISKVAFPLPPLPEQRRIAAILDKADALREKRRQAIAKLDELLKSVFIEMFGDPVTNPKGLPTKPIKEFGKVTTGNTPSRSDSEFYGAKIEWIKSDNINTPYHVLTAAEEWLSEKGQAVGRTVPAGSILVTCIAGSRDCIGNVALADREVAFNQQINAITPNRNTNPHFLYTQILLAKRLIQRASTDSMKGMVSKSAFSEIELLSPPEQDQEKFGLWFERFHATFKNLHKALKIQENLFTSLQQRAFSGELFTEKAVSVPHVAEVSQHV